MNEAKLQEIEARANETVRRCVASFGCDAPARWQRTEAFGVARACDACAGDRSGWSPIGSSDLDALDLVAEVRRLTAALDAARREGAEGMRAALIARFKARVEYLRPWAEAEADENGCHAGAWTEALNAGQFTREMALPLDAPGGGS